ncbi:MAG: hypothetical protein ACR2PU_02310 [Gammaproteobacteria bacterium]
MDDINKAIRIASHLKQIRSSDTVQYELMTNESVHKFSLTTRHLMQTVFVSTNYLTDHTLNTIISDMDIRHVEKTLKSSDQPKAFFLGYTSSGRVIFSVTENENILGHIDKTKGCILEN